MTYTYKDRDDLCPPDFRYPLEYNYSSSRITDAKDVEGFHELFRPYLIHDESGKVAIDPRIDSSIKNRILALLETRGGNLISLEQLLRWDDKQAEGTDAKFKCESRIDQASYLVDAGFYGLALLMLKALPESFQKSEKATQIYATSHIEIGNWAEGLEAIRRLQKFENPYDYMRDSLERQELRLMFLLGQRPEVECILNSKREKYATDCFYYGIRAAIALADGDESLAKNLVSKASRLKIYGSKHLLTWPELKPLRGFMLKECLDERLFSLHHRRNSDQRLLAHRIIGATLIGDTEFRETLWETVSLKQVAELDASIQCSIAMLGSGMFNVLDAAAHFLPGADKPPMQLCRLLAKLALRPEPGHGESLIEQLKKAGASSESLSIFPEMLPFFETGHLDKIPELGTVFLAEYAGLKEGKHTRSFLFSTQGEKAKRLEYHVSERFHILNPRPRQELIENHTPAEIQEFETHQGAELWLESLDWTKKRGAYLDGWGFLQRLRPDPSVTPKLAWVIKNMQFDPYLYFKNPGGGASGSTPPLGDQIVRILLVFLKNRPNSP